jgi:hypothetical protein
VGYDPLEGPCPTAGSYRLKSCHGFRAFQAGWYSSRLRRSAWSQACSASLVTAQEGTRTELYVLACGARQRPPWPCSCRPLRGRSVAEASDCGGHPAAPADYSFAAGFDARGRCRAPHPFAAGPGGFALSAPKGAALPLTASAVAAFRPPLRLAPVRMASGVLQERSRREGTSSLVNALRLQVSHVVRPLIGTRGVSVLRATDRPHVWATA